MSDRSKHAKAKPSRGPGRPLKPADERLEAQLNVRVDAVMRQAVEEYRKRYGAEYNLREMADAVRHMLGRVLKDEGLM